MMDAIIKIKITEPKHSRMLGTTIGVINCIEKLKEDRDKFGKLPGYETAIALLEGIGGEYRGSLASMNFRLAAKHGHDISTASIGVSGAGEITVEPFDLAEMAEQAE